MITKVLTLLSLSALLVVQVTANPTLPVVEPAAARPGRLSKRLDITSVRCQESYNKMVDRGICKTLGVKAPPMTDCAQGAASWRDKEEKLGPLSSRGEYPNGECAVSVYNQGKKKVTYSRAALGNWWNAAAAACVYPGSPYDSAYCTLIDDDDNAGPVVLVMTRKGHNKDFGLGKVASK